jgi:hypothetical protein
MCENHRGTPACVLTYAEDRFGDLSDVELLRRLLMFRKKWNEGTLRVRHATAVAMMFVERGRRLELDIEDDAS